MRIQIAILLIGVLASSACNYDFTSDLPPGIPCDAGDPAGWDPVQGVSFDSEQMPCLSIEMNASDFREMAHENRFGDSLDESFETIVTILMKDCVTPYPNNFSWFEADVKVGGVVTGQVGIRKKGFLGSVIENGMVKPSIKIKTDRHVSGQFMGNTERLTLNNNNQDQSQIRSCLAYDLFAAADYPAPLCNMANVMINSKAMGAYTHVEPIKKRFLERAFGDGSGSLYEGALTDLTPDHSTEFDQGNLGRFEAKTDDTDPYGLPLLNLMQALLAPDEELLIILDRVLNLDRFITYWALEVLINHTDGYSMGRNNFYIYFDPSDMHRAVFIPWGVDDVFNGGTKIDHYLNSEIARRLSRLPQTAARMEQELTRLLEEVWHEEAILASIDSYGAQVKTAQDDPKYDDVLATHRKWVRERPLKVQQMLSDGLPQGKPQATPCDMEAEDLLQALPDLMAQFVFGW